MARIVNSVILFFVCGYACSEDNYRIIIRGTEEQVVREWENFRLAERCRVGRIAFPDTKIIKEGDDFLLVERVILPIGDEFPDSAIEDLAELVARIGADGLTRSDICLGEEQTLYVLGVSRYVGKPDLKAVTGLLNSLPEKADVILNKLGIKNDTVYKRLNPVAAGSLYRMMAVIHKILKENGIPYWVVAGSYLGLIRHGGIIPWDDDGDIQIFEKDYTRLMVLGKEFGKYGYELVRRSFIPLSLRLKAEFNPHGNRNFPSVDIFTAKRINGRYAYANPNARLVFANEYWEEGELFLPSGELNIKEFPFGPIKVSAVAARDKKRYCLKAYGKYCFEWAVQGADHEKGGKFQAVETFIVTREAAEFARPPEWGVGEIEFDAF